MFMEFCTHGHLKMGKRGFTFGSHYSRIKYVVKYASLLHPLLFFSFFFNVHVNANSHLLFFNNLLFFFKSQLLNYRQQFNKPTKKIPIRSINKVILFRSLVNFLISKLKLHKIT